MRKFDPLKQNSDFRLDVVNKRSDFHIHTLTRTFIHAEEYVAI